MTSAGEARLLQAKRLTNSNPGFQTIGSWARHIAAARIVDREFEYNLWLKFGGWRLGGCAPPHPPAFQGGGATPYPPKGAPRPWLQGLVAFRRNRPTRQMIAPQIAIFFKIFFEKCEVGRNTATRLVSKFRQCRNWVVAIAESTGG